MKVAPKIVGTLSLLTGVGLLVAAAGTLAIALPPLMTGTCPALDPSNVSALAGLTLPVAVPLLGGTPMLDLMCSAAGYVGGPLAGLLGVSGVAMSGLGGLLLRST